MSECGREASIMRRPWPITKRFLRHKKEKGDSDLLGVEARYGSVTTITLT